ncbi:hypothetical protein ASD97_24650 [Streptomyces sp. Root63]|uniref:hypothetical protein n=1 Tax=unclassified Streptomyces TaxID=2593676 RepID=UPI0006FBF463|nr:MULTISPECIES: hypothetical protein [unclassified Streptomyces]KQX27496.1 hypothetical protein ASD29_29880 [Streptomyces sp. Root1295]KRA34736.1 hypothetical protein ASD97_24650 [Streptomyces sp. Root63]
MTTVIRRKAPHHNTLTCYTEYGCRLPECVERKRLWQVEVRRKQREGAWQPFVDAKPVRAHLLNLREHGISTNRVAAATGLDKATLRAFVPPTGTGKRRPIRHQTRPDVAAKILSVTVETLRAHDIDGTGSRRRIQALAAAGWPFRRLDTHLGLSAQYIGDLVRRTENDFLVRADTADRVAEGYETLRGQRPSRHGIKPHIIRRVRTQAAERRWPTQSYWDQFPDAIDDPHFTPEYKVTQAEILATEAQWLIQATSLSRAEVAERLGKDKSYIDRVLNQAQLKAAA